IDAPSSYCAFLPDVDKYVGGFNFDDFDTIISVDVGAHYLLKFHEKMPELLQKNKPFINIDHHPSNDNFGTVNIVDPHAAAAAQIVYHFLRFCNFQINYRTATALLHGLYFDTGSFMHSNTTPEVLRIAADLIWRGADYRTIAKYQFKTKRLGQMKLWGRAFSRINVNEKRVVSSYVTSQDFAECDAIGEDTAGAIDYLNAVPDGDFSLFLSEDGKGNVKGSLRTRSEEVDVCEVAGIFGGGGHKKASGFSLPGKISVESGRIRIVEPPKV
ncbi:MAG: DHHA1 domain-containing protein, partial [Patescibacteria group bacterium]